LPPLFQPPQSIAERDIVPLMNKGRYTFVVDIPPNFQRDVLGGRRPGVQVDVDATAMVQAGLGSGYAQQIITNEIRDFLSHSEGVPLATVNLDVRIAFNPTSRPPGSSSAMSIINNVTCWDHSRRSGSSRTREPDHDHLLVMPLTPPKSRCQGGRTARITVEWSAFPFTSSFAPCSAFPSPVRYRCSWSA
jgi:ABC-2 type transport system permease protein